MKGNMTPPEVSQYLNNQSYMADKMDGMEKSLNRIADSFEALGTLISDIFDALDKEALDDEG